jgi:ATP-dependent exoDNAse (exonuclease V) alpha subunit
MYFVRRARNAQNKDTAALPAMQLLCPMNRGGVGARGLYLEIQAAMNPAGERKVERFGWTLAPGPAVELITPTPS